MAELELTIEELQSRLNAVGDSKGLTRGFQQLLRGIRNDLIWETKRNFDNSVSPDGKLWADLAHPRPNSQGEDKPLQDAGIFRSSVTAANTQHNVNEETQHGFEWGTSHPGAWVHQKGAIIVPTIAKYLAIPATMKAKYAGSPRNFPTKLKFRFGKKGGVAFTTLGKGKSLREVIQYYFTKSVTIPARPFLGITNRMADRYEEMAADWFETAVVERISRGF